MPEVIVGLGMPDPDTPLTTPEAAQAVNVSLHTVRKWRTRGWTGPDGTHKQLAVVDFDRNGHPMHAYRDVLAAERETNGSGKSHRRLAGPQPEALAEINVRPVSSGWAALNRS
jgi:hypothetical protein